MASSAHCKINRRTVRRVIKRGHITGTDLRACAIDIVTALGLHPTCYQKAHEVLNALVAEHQVILTDSLLRLTTEEEQQQARQVAATKQRQRVMTRRMTATKRAGGMRNLQVRMTRPIPVRITS